MNRYLTQLFLVCILVFIPGSILRASNIGLELSLEGVECFDGVDNDNDGFIDFPNDPDCISALGDDEGEYVSDGEESSTVSSSGSYITIVTVESPANQETSFLDFVNTFLDSTLVLIDQQINTSESFQDIPYVSEIPAYQDTFESNQSVDIPDFDFEDNLTDRYEIGEMDVFVDIATYSHRKDVPGEFPYFIIIFSIIGILAAGHFSLMSYSRGLTPLNVCFGKYVLFITPILFFLIIFSVGQHFINPNIISVYPGDVVKVKTVITPQANTLPQEILIKNIVNSKYFNNKITVNSDPVIVEDLLELDGDGLFSLTTQVSGEYIDTFIGVKEINSYDYGPRSKLLLLGFATLLLFFIQLFIIRKCKK